MDAALKAKWVEALRSGKYAQGKRQLKYRDHYCCLGVLCDVAGVKIPQHSGWIPGEFRNDQDLGRFEIGLMNMNDKYDKSFSEIADYIEAKIPAVPTQGKV